MWQTLSIKVDKHQQIYARMHLFITLYTDLKYLAAARWRKKVPQISVKALSKSVRELLNCRRAQDYDQPATGTSKKEVQALIQEHTEYEDRVWREEKERQELAKEMPVCKETQKAQNNFASRRRSARCSSTHSNPQSINSSFECSLCNAGVHTATNMWWKALLGAETLSDPWWVPLTCTALPPLHSLSLPPVSLEEEGAATQRGECKTIVVKSGKLWNKKMRKKMREWQNGEWKSSDLQL